MLFTDIEGSTRLLQQLGERYAEMLADCRQVLRSSFAQWQGQEVDTQGDAFFAVFAKAWANGRSTPVEQVIATMLKMAEGTRREPVSPGLPLVYGKDSLRA